MYIELNIHREIRSEILQMFKSGLCSSAYSLAIRRLLIDIIVVYSQFFRNKYIFRALISYMLNFSDFQKILISALCVFVDLQKIICMY